MIPEAAVIRTATSDLKPTVDEDDDEPVDGEIAPLEQSLVDKLAGRTGRRHRRGDTVDSDIIQLDIDEGGTNSVIGECCLLMMGRQSKFGVPRSFSLASAVVVTRTEHA